MASYFHRALLCFFHLFLKLLLTAILSFMNKIKTVCVFTGSSYGNCDIYRKDAITLASIFKESDISLVYGGGNKGIMGVLAKELKRLGGHVIGVLPKAMDLPSVRSEDVESQLIIVDGMHERKEKMYALSDAFIALPGGIGTLEELSEIFTWRQLGYHKKNVALMNTSGYYDSLLAFLQHTVDEGFMDKSILDELIVIKNIEDTIHLLERDVKELPEKL